MGVITTLGNRIPPNTKTLILFDGVCNLCNSKVDFLIKKDSKNKFVFASLQSSISFQILGDGAKTMDSLVTIRNKVVYTKSRAVLEIIREMTGVWPVLYFFVVVPFFIRDPIYNYVAKRRYRWYGQRNSCRIPSEVEKNRFIE